MSAAESAQSQSDLPTYAPHSPVYNVFILVLTVFSLFVMVFQLLPILTEATRQTLLYIDTLICIVFLYDFFDILRRSSPKSDYFFKHGGWIDLLGSIPSTPALRLLRLARLGRIIRYMRNRSNAAALWSDFKKNRARSTFMLTVLTAIVTITICSVLVLQVERRSDNPNIVTGGDAFWWAFVTVTTVGYGDRYPTTTLGRTFGIVLMSLGVVFFGVLTSFLAHFFLSGEAELEDSDQDEEITEIEALRSEIGHLRNESAQMQEQLQKLVAMLEEGKTPDHPG